MTEGGGFTRASADEFMAARIDQTIILPFGISTRN